MARDNKERENEREERSELIEKPVAIRRVAKVVKGGRRFGIAALVVVGDGKGRVGYGTGKAKEAPDAMRKATDAAKKSMIRIPLREGRTLHHDLYGRFGAGKVIIRSAPTGTGIIAGGPMRAVFDAMGVKNVSAKCHGSTNPYNIVRATIDGLSKMMTPADIAAKRGKTVAEILGVEEQ